MNTPSAPRPVLIPPEFDSSNPFGEDVFSRKQLADRLTGYIDRLRDGCVIAIDAPWGEGKSWFGRRWAEQLKSQGHKVAYIDAFKHDHVEDPFVMVCAEIINALGSKKAAKVKKSGLKVAKALAPTALKIGINAVGRLVGTSDICGEVGKAVEDVSASAADAAKDYFSKRFEDYEAAKKSVDGFAETLAEAADAEEKPIIIFIDELDRCRPDFAVRTIERIKHFFDVPKVIFVLLLNRQQLEAAVCGVYGEKTDAATYLGKFVHLFLRLPKRNSLYQTSQNHSIQYCRHLARILGFQPTNEVSNFTETFGTIATLLDFSFRHLERGYTLLALAGANGEEISFLAWPVALKVAEPDIFSGVLLGKAEAHKLAGDLIENKLTQLQEETTQRDLKMFRDLHRAHQTESFSHFPEETTEILKYLNSRVYRFSFRDFSKFLPYWCQRVDFDID
ncbi:MAG: hypothetical protein HQL44_10975 [Alphaproteobacteria bacterium]|nr:hypothetical protein [Alphaproteobacteria bacterium]